MNDNFFFFFDIIIHPVFWQPTLVCIIGMLHCCNELVKIIINNFVNVEGICPTSILFVYSDTALKLPHQSFTKQISTRVALTRHLPLMRVRGSPSSLPHIENWST